MKKNILLTIALFSALSLSQCSLVKDVFKDLNDLSTKEGAEKISSSSSKTQISSSGSETLKKRKEAN